MKNNNLLKNGVYAVGLVIVGLLLYKFVYAPEPKTTIANIGEPETITVHWDNKAISVPESSPFYEQIVLATEKLLDSSTTPYEKEVDESVLKGSSFIEIEYEKEQAVKIKGAGDGGETSVQKLIVPLQGKYFDTEHLIAVEGTSAPDGFVVPSYSLDELRSIGELYYLNVTSSGSGGAQ